MHDHICSLPSCAKPYQHKNPFSVGCCKEHALEFNRLTVRHGKRPKKTKKVGFASSRPGHFGPVDVCTRTGRGMA